MDVSAPPDVRLLVGAADADALARLVDGLVADGLHADGVGDMAALLAAARAGSPDVVVVDGGVSADGAGAAVRQIREASDCYLVVLLAEPDEMAAVLALALGADDVVPWSTTPRELAARARAMLRRPRALVAPPRPVGIGRLVIDPMGRVATGPSGALALTRTEFEILWALAEAERAVVERSRLGERVWGPAWLGDEHLLDVHVSNLRGKLRDACAGVVITTVRGVGFRAEQAP